MPARTPAPRAGGPQPAGAGPRPPAGAARDPLVDALRTVALGRVVLWHAFAAAWLSWVFPAMPVMFFLAGSLLPGGARGAPSGAAGWWRWVRRRARRLLVPFWVYGGVVALTSWLSRAAAGEAAADPGRWWPGAATWVLPLVQPAAPAVQQGWLSSHLWYVTDYLWLLLLAPLVLLLARRVAAVLAVALPLLALLEVAPLLGWPAPHGVLRVVLGDLLCYGTFAVLGAAWARGAGAPVGAAPRAHPRALAAGGVALVLLAAAVATRVPLPRGSLNASYLLLTLSGLGWLLLLAAAQRPLRRLSGRRALSRVTRLVTARAVSVYLWHAAAIVLARTWVGGSGWRADALVLCLTVACTALAVLLFGWIEDLAARRPVRVRPRAGAAGVAAVTAVGTAVGAAGAAIALAAALATGPTGTLAVIPGPSDRSALADSAFDRSDPVPVRREPPAELPADELQRALERWVASTPEVDAATVAVASGQALWTGSVAPQIGEGAPPERPAPVASMTKSMTGALVVRAAAQGAIDLDAPVPDLPGVAPLPVGTTVTPRQLLRHTSGLVQYADAPGYDPGRTYDAAELVSLSTRAPLLAAPGRAVHYSNSNYLWLGLLLQDVTGSSFADLLAEQITGPLALGETSVPTDPVPGWVGQASGGVVSTVGDTARWYWALLHSDTVLDARWRAEAVDLEEDNVGLGTWPLCPCGRGGDGAKWATGYGQVVWDGGGYAFPAEQVAVVVRLDPPGPSAMDLAPSLMAALRAALAG
ncbi:serine hydrolase domain-containing protein [Kineococcus sp. SYSU DK005]|uniref:serine hydrolase domain-containing protein n=1 Tax=Kineococcus sp. SYSU DK005 TaxID=3383126 RepID=UPI003D7E5BF3